MNRTMFAKSVARRTVLAGVGAGVLGSLLRPLQAQEAGAIPKRLLIVHRPCGTVLEKFFPVTGDARNFELTPILSSLAPLKNDMIIVNGVNCPRDQGWPADQHAAGMIAMMSGKKFGHIPGTDAGTDQNAKNIIAVDKSIDQHLLTSASALQGTPIPSIQSTAYLPSSIGLPCFKVMSYKGNNQPLFPASDAARLFKDLFVGDNAGLSPEQIARKQAQSKSVLDRVHADLTRLQGLIPASQKPKLDAHLSGIQGLEQALQNGGTPGKTCDAPDQQELPGASDGITKDEAQHLKLAQNQLAIIQTAFQCDLTRVATFSFAHGNSDLRFVKIDPNIPKAENGHHSVSHDTGAAEAQERIDRIYAEQLSMALQKMKAVPEGNGSLLDNTLVVYFNECAHGNEHTIKNMPVLMLGGKNLGLQGGQHLNFNGAWMNDLWAAVCGTFGVEAKFGDSAFAKTPLSGLFA